ncbi:hypothetical protein BDV30DRAFT_247350 [Aspergillus minisclerotigenes]|uniref:Uncharacterized protein n=1 Tax=Aspergillus minisclerotigenes TaxID=656917 RepID=A0A5N6IKC0_9EURO|nr:hypothetical protein BDV30DRAFT_247350 [Aspergillus minisclerotigenes]
MAKMKNFATVTGYLTRTLIIQQSITDKASGLVESGVCFQTRYTNKYGIDRFTKARKDLQPLFTSQTCIFPVGLFALIVFEQSQIIRSHVPQPTPHAGPVVKVSAWVGHMTNHSDRNETTTSTLTFTDGSPGQRIEHYR